MRGILNATLILTSAVVGNKPGGPLIAAAAASLMALHHGREAPLPTDCTFFHASPQHYFQHC